MKTRIYLSIAFAGVSMFIACKRMDSTYEKYVVPNGIIYPGKATSPSVKPGLNRIQISWARGTDPKVVKARIFWNNYRDSVEVPVPADQDIISYTIPNLAENYYTFIIKTYDKDGRVSVPVEVSGDVWGERYRSTLLNRLAVSSTINLANTLTIQFEPVLAGSTIVKSEVEYTTTAGALKTVTVLPGTLSLQLTDYKKETGYKLRTQHLNPTAIDPFYTNDQLVDGFLLNKTEWKIAAYSSYNTTDANNVSAPANMIDGNPATRWLSLVSASYPHFVTVDFGTQRTLRTVSLWRWVQTAPDERGPNVVQFFGSLDNTTWTDLGTYNFDRLTNNEQIYTIPNLPQARYLMVKAISGPQVYVILGEVNVTVK
ncbi:DUF4998 domain-containing protein [Pedobacter heparinus]|uniref:Coagulation factor 5/8 type domain protein n=1 Tax=Pedobacter heparinus (strain ATCC 13125 / DSM 2366 / CIP 104194 / JCM 7457 / NBRC 12017 / NCIMB 9290 / NRRL B-14731 / HIM 762-3) TaxID=485917 RepID=C6XWK0_PEDHD|nr:DUF4998 domain-containing protein [Pedobacter heparinus]ACU06289.1 coagulation factor 5/8 type domain protein [Pedobacter heparinus DSM 2366]